MPAAENPRGISMRIKLLYSIGIIGLLCSCTLVNPHDPSGQNQTGTSVPSINFAPNPQAAGSYVFQTNSSGDLNNDFICYDTKSAQTGDFDYAVTVTKSSGADKGGFGIIFQLTDAYNYWLLNIDLTGHYYLSKFMTGLVAGTTKENIVRDWTPFGGLPQNSGVPAKIEIIFTSSTSTYQIKFNDQAVTPTFTDNGDYGSALTGGCLGLNAVVMPSENFPAIPVTISFAIVKPTSLNFASPTASLSLRAVTGVH